MNRKCVYISSGHLDHHQLPVKDGEGNSSLCFLTLGFRPALTCVSKQLKWFTSTGNIMFKLIPFMILFFLSMKSGSLFFSPSNWWSCSCFVVILSPPALGELANEQVHVCVWESVMLGQVKWVCTLPWLPGSVVFHLCWWPRLPLSKSRQPYDAQNTQPAWPARCCFFFTCRTCSRTKRRYCCRCGPLLWCHTLQRDLGI